jgi:hypothetical protein
MSKPPREYQPKVKVNEQYPDIIITSEKGDEEYYG